MPGDSVDVSRMRRVDEIQVGLPYLVAFHADCVSGQFLATLIHRDTNPYDPPEYILFWSNGVRLAGYIDNFTIEEML